MIKDMELREKVRNEVILDRILEKTVDEATDEILRVIGQSEQLSRCECPECLQLTDTQELDMFGGLCEECRLSI